LGQGYEESFYIRKEDRWIITKAHLLASVSETVPKDEEKVCQSAAWPELVD